MQRSIPLLLLSLTLSSCGLRAGPSAPSEFQVQIKNASTMAMDSAEQRASHAMHSFLLGQLHYAKEESNRALQHFEAARDSTETSIPLLSERLAELYLQAGQVEKALVEAHKIVDSRPDDVQAKLFLAGLLDAIGRTEDTLPLYERALSLNPRSLEAAVMLATYHRNHSNPEQGISVLQTFTKENPRDAMGYYFLGQAQEALGSVANAAGSFRQARVLDIHNVAIAAEYMEMLLRLKRVHEARDLCAEILRKEPDNSLFVYLNVQLSQGDDGLDKAADQLANLTQVTSDPVEVRFRIATLNIERRNFESALDALRAVLAARPENSQARYYVASMYAGSGRKRQAVEELDKIERGQELYVKSRTFAAFVLRQDGDLVRAERAVREALAQEPDNKSILSYLILILRDAKKFEEAERLMRRSVEEDPQNDRLLFNYGILLHDMQRKQEANTVMEKVLELNPQHTDALNFLAYDLAESGVNLDRALELINRALQVRPSDGYYLDTLGWVYYQQGRYHDAVDILSRAASVATDDVLIQEHYADSLMKVGQITQAIEVYRNALERGRDAAEKAEAEVISRLEQKLMAAEREASATQVLPTQSGNK